MKNGSFVNYTDILVKLDQDHLYEDLTASEVSEYQKFDWAYRYAYVELMIDGILFVLQPIDYVGETPLDDGHYTYIISLNESEKRLVAGIKGRLVSDFSSLLRVVLTKKNLSLI